MKKFAEFTEQDQIQMIKDEFVQLLEFYVGNPDDLKKLMNNDQIELFNKYIPKLKKIGCLCGQCLNSSSLSSSRVPPELDPIIDIARKNAQEKNY